MAGHCSAMSNHPSTHASQARESGRKKNGQFGSWESGESNARLSATPPTEASGALARRPSSRGHLLDRETVGHGDPLTVHDGLVDVDVTAHGNFTPGSGQINVDNGEGLVLAVGRGELRRRSV